MKKVCTFAPAFSKEPHSSSGPGHLPLTQKIISSTLICGTKATNPQGLSLFFFSSFYLFSLLPKTSMCLL